MSVTDRFINFLTILATEFVPMMTDLAADSVRNDALVFLYSSYDTTFCVC